MSAAQTSQTSQTSSEPMLLELDGQSWSTFLDRYESWLGNVLMLQTAFGRMIQDTVGKIHEPHIRDYIAETGEMAQRHEEQVRELYRLIGRDPANARTLGGTVMSKMEELLANVQGAAGGAVGGWRELRQLLIVNLDCLGAFAVAEQLGLALGLPETVDITFPVIHEKQTTHLLLQEYMLEMASQSILYKEPV